METRAAARRLAVSPAALAMLAAASAGWAAEAAGFAWRVELGKGWPVISHNTQRLPLMAYRGETERLLTIELGEGPAPKAQLRGGWEHQRAEYDLAGGKASVVVSRLTPAVLVESDGKAVTLRPAAPFGHVAFVKGGKVAVAAGEPAGPPDEPWLLLWFGKGSPLSGRVTPFDVEDEHGVSKERLNVPPPAVDLPVLVRLEHKPAAIRRTADGAIALAFAGRAGKLAVMPLFGGRVFLPAETDKWSAGLPADVLAQCRLWSAKLRDVPLTVTETCSADPAAGELTVRQEFTWASFADDWNSPAVKAAPVPPMLAVALGGGADVHFLAGGREVRPVDLNLMDTPGKAMAIEGVDAYEYRIAGLGELIEPASKAAEATPAAEPYRRKLEQHVRRMIEAGHLQPLLYIYGGIGGTWFSHYYWSSTAELAVALAEAHPHLPKNLQAEAAAYLKAEWAKFPALRFDPQRYRSGAPRVPYELPLAEMRQAAHAMQREQRYRAADGLFELYGVDAWLRLTGEAAPAGLKDEALKLAAPLLGRKDWAILGPDRLRDERDRHAVFYYNLQGAATYNRWLAGAIGLTRLARRCGWKDVEPIGWQLVGKLAMARVAQARYVAAMHEGRIVRGAAGDDNRALLHIDATCAVVGRGPLEMGVHQNQELPPFYDLAPEVGRLLGRAARAECRAYLDQLDRSLPLWWISEAPKQQATEHRTSPLQNYGGTVLAQSWVLHKRGGDFARYVDTSRFVGDLYVIRNLAAAIEGFEAPAEAPAKLPARAVGVNYFDAFYRTLKDPNDTSYDAGFAALAERGIPFARFLCGGFWPAENRLYLADRERYFRLLDAVVRSAERHGVGLMPSLFWHVSTVPDLVGEPCDAWGDPRSKTHAFMRTYVREVVTRYKASPAVWGWEFGNEYNLAADLPNAAQHRPPVAVKLGTPTTRSARDELSRDAIRTAFVEFAREVRRHDPRRLITTGNSLPRPSAWHQRAERSWKPDTREQFAEVLLGDHPDPLNAISVHVYRTPERLDWAAAAARDAGKLLFVGEFGVPGKDTPDARRQFAELLGAVERSGAPLAALWVYDFAGQTDWSVTATNDRAWQLDALADANRRFRAAR